LRVGSFGRGAMPLRKVVEGGDDMAGKRLNGRMAGFACHVKERGFRVASADAGADDAARALSLVVAFSAANRFPLRRKML
jgi:hypothetical protein